MTNVKKTRDIVSNCFVSFRVGEKAMCATALFAFGRLVFQLAENIHISPPIPDLSSPYHPLICTYPI